MRKFIVIVAVAVGYALFETVFLLSMIVANYGYTLDTYQKIVLFGQLITIPGMAALLSRIMYGPRGLGRRTFTIFLVGSLGVPVALILIGITSALLSWVADGNWFLFAVLLPVVIGAIVVTFLFLMRKLVKWSAVPEAERWLAERQAGTNPSERRWYDRGIRLSVCTPSILVLPMFLFLPEICGILTHLGLPQAGNLSGYRVKIPATWIILGHEDQHTTGWSRVSGVIGRGIGLGSNPFRYDSFSHWYITTEPFNSSDESRLNHWMPKDENIVSRHIFTIGDENVTCLDYRYANDYKPENTGTTAIVNVECSGSSRLGGEFYGARSEVATFYRMLEGITPMK